MLHTGASKPSQSDPYDYDVFASYSPADRAWVHRWLLPHLKQAELRVFDYDDFVVGSPKLVNIEHAVEHSRRTIVVLTPDWFDNEWNAFEDLLVRTADPAARRRKLIPLLLKPCELPKALAMLDRVDFTDERRWNKETRRLTRDLVDLDNTRRPTQRISFSQSADGRLENERVGVQIAIGGAKANGNTATTGAAQGLLLTVTGAILHQQAVPKGQAVVTTVDVRTVESLPIHYDLAEQVSECSVEDTSNRVREAVSHQGS